MLKHLELNKSQIFQKIKSEEIKFAGNVKLKIFGKLNCKSGKRMKVENKVFFKNREEANFEGFRPCGHCLRNEYLIWKTNVMVILK